MQDPGYFRDLINSILCEQANKPEPDEMTQLKIKKILRSVHMGSIKITPDRSAKYLHIEGFDFSMGGLDNINKITIDLQGRRPMLHVFPKSMPDNWWNISTSDDDHFMAYILNRILHIIGFTSIENMRLYEMGNGFATFAFSLSDQDREKINKLISGEGNE